MAKLIVGWFTFTCSEDSTMLMIEALNTHWQDWTKKIDFKYAKAFRNSPPLGPMDVAFVEGAISSANQAKRLTQIRSLAKTLVAIGACAVTGYPSAQRNLFNPEKQTAIKPILEKFSYNDKVQKLADIVTVDYFVPGCPMDETKFVELINKLLAQANASS
ncbi:MAG: hypothetical protein U0946_07765 [Patescibacteria group bacterium]|nr:hypothetical protein [Patescibacteria group bacterium]